MRKFIHRLRSLVGKPTMPMVNDETIRSDDQLVASRQLLNTKIAEMMDTVDRQAVTIRGEIARGRRVIRVTDDILDYIQKVAR